MGSIDFKKLITIVPIGLAFIGSMYAAFNVFAKMSNELNAATMDIARIDTQVNSIDDKFSTEIKNLNQNYTMGREEFVLSFSELRTELLGLREKANALSNALSRTASEAEFRALEQSYYKLSDSINQFKYDIKEVERVLNGGY